MTIKSKVYNYVNDAIRLYACWEGEDWFVYQMSVTNNDWQLVYDRAPADWLVWLADEVSWGTPGPKLWRVFDGIDETDCFWNGVVKWVPEPHRDWMHGEGNVMGNDDYLAYMDWLADVIRNEIPTVEEFIKECYGDRWEQEWESDE